MTRWLGLSLVLIGLLRPGWAVSEERSYLTNIEMVEQAVRVAADSMVVLPPEGRSPDLEIEAGAGAEAMWLVEGVLRERLMAAGWNVKAKSAAADSVSASSAEFQLKVRIIDLGLIYARTWRRHLVFGRAVERAARVSCLYDLIDKSNGDVLVSASARAEVRDVVPASALPALSDSKYPFASPALEKGQWDRFIEGILVLAIVGVLIYLFYSNKTA